MIPKCKTDLDKQRVRDGVRVRRWGFPKSARPHVVTLLPGMEPEVREANLGSYHSPCANFLHPSCPF